MDHSSERQAGALSLGGGRLSVAGDRLVQEWDPSVVDIRHVARIDMKVSLGPNLNEGSPLVAAKALPRSGAEYVRTHLSSEKRRNLRIAVLRCERRWIV